jgi:hypothetical protein
LLIQPQVNHRKSRFFFHVQTDIALPEHLPDGKGKPVLGVVSLRAGSVDVEAMVTTKGDQRPVNSRT